MPCRPSPPPRQTSQRRTRRHIYVTARNEPVEVTDEDLRLLASGTWTPDCGATHRRVGLLPYPSARQLVVSDFEATQLADGTGGGGEAGGGPHRRREGEDRLGGPPPPRPSIAGTLGWVKNLADAERIRRQAGGEIASITRHDAAYRQELDATYAEGSPAWRDQKMRCGRPPASAAVPGELRGLRIAPAARHLFVDFILRRDVEPGEHRSGDEGGRLARIARHLEALEAEAMRLSVPVPVARFDFDTPWGPEDDEAMRARADGDPVPEKFEEIVEAFHAAMRAERDRRLSLGDSASVRRYDRAREKLVHDLETQPSLRERGEWERAAAVAAGQDGGWWKWLATDLVRLDQAYLLGEQPPSTMSHLPEPAAATPHLRRRRGRVAEHHLRRRGPAARADGGATMPSLPRADHADPIPDVTALPIAGSPPREPEDVPRERWEPQWGPGEDEAMREWAATDGRRPRCRSASGEPAKRMQAAIEREKDRRHTIGDARSIRLFEEQRLRIQRRLGKRLPLDETVRRGATGFWALLHLRARDAAPGVPPGRRPRASIRRRSHPSPPARACPVTTPDRGVATHRTQTPAPPLPPGPRSEIAPHGGAVTERSEGKGAAATLTAPTTAPPSCAGRRPAGSTWRPSERSPRSWAPGASDRGLLRRSPPGTAAHRPVLQTSRPTGGLFHLNDHRGTDDCLASPRRRHRPDVELLARL